MSHKHLLAAAVGATSVLSGCALGLPGVPGLPGFGSNTPLPLAAGNVWNYKTTTSVGATTYAGSSTVKVDTYAKTGNTEEATLVTNTTLNIPNATQLDEKDEKTKVLKTENELTIGEGNDAEKWPVPLEVGKGWSLGTGSAKVDLKETVKVPAGEFKDTFKISYTTPGDTRTSGAQWVAPGVGVVKRQLTSISDQGKVDIVFELTTYTVK